MKYSTMLFASLAVCYSTANAAPDATYAGNTLHIPQAIYQGTTYDVTMRFQSPKLILESAEPVADAALFDSAFATVNIADDLDFSLSEIKIGRQIFRADLAYVKDSATEFIATGITSINTTVSLSDSLNIAYYNLANPKTGNDQLIVYDANTNNHTVVKTDVILGRNNFVFGGVKQGNKTVYQSRKFGIYLDPTKENEPRNAADGRGGQFEYNFYFDNAFKRYDVKNPSSEALIFDASLLSPALKAAGLKVMDGEYKLFNNITDPDNSYVEIKAFEKLPDVLRGEPSSSLLHAPILIRLSDAKHTNAHYIASLTDSQGKVTQVLNFYDAVHKKGAYPSGNQNRKRLQLCQADLTGCQDVGQAGGDADGKFFYQAETQSHIYLSKEGVNSFYAFNKSNHSLAKVTGVEFPAVFNHKKHVVASDLGHGSEVESLSNFSSLSGMKVSLSEGNDAFLAINYDLDTKDPVGKYQFLGDIHVYKHAQIIKFNGLTGQKMFDNGDGVDHGDDSDNEKTEGHINLIAVSNNKLLFELGNYDGESAKGRCKPDDKGYYCSSLKYGYLNVTTANAQAMDSVLHSMPKLKFFTARRIAPFAVNDSLYISLLAKEGGRGASHQYTLHTHLLNNLGSPTQLTGRTYVTRSAKRSNGINEGEVLAWDGATNILSNLTRNIPLGNVNDSTANAITSTFGRTTGIPLAGIGNLFALRADPGGHQWYLIAGEVDKENGLETVDHVPLSSWIYQ